MSSEVIAVGTLRVGLLRWHALVSQALLEDDKGDLKRFIEASDKEFRNSVALFALARAHFQKIWTWLSE